MICTNAAERTDAPLPPPTALPSGRKIGTLPASDEPFHDPLGQVAGFSPHAGVAAEAHQRQKLSGRAFGLPYIGVR